jgi:hypothetical protein
MTRIDFLLAEFAHETTITRKHLERLPNHQFDWRHVGGRRARIFRRRILAPGCTRGYGNVALRAGRGCLRDGIAAGAFVMVSRKPDGAARPNCTHLP